MDCKREFFACLALRHTPGIGAKTWKSILEAFPSAYDAVQQCRDWPAYGVANARQAKACAQEAWREAAECEYRDASHRNLPVLTWNDPDYPARLRQIADPPAYLYYRGDPKLLSAPSIAVVGARECTRFGLEAADRISRSLSRSGVTIISGMAYGIDRQAHQAALAEIGSTVGVLGTGLDVPYPSANVEVKKAVAHKGCLVTEFAPSAPPEAKNFPLRNRIISGLALGVLVAEASARSGSLITARLAAEQGREVFALPGPVGQATFSGCHRLIKQGASLVEDADEILEALHYALSLDLQEGTTSSGKKQPAIEQGAETQGAPCSVADAPAFPGNLEKCRHERAARHDNRTRHEKEPLPPLVGDELALYESLIGVDKLHVDDLGRSLGWESSRVSTALIMLEVKGLLRQLPGMWYTAREA